MEFVDKIKQMFAVTVHISRDAATDAKIRRLVSDGPEKLQIISDFDRTISCSEYNGRPVLSSFGVFEMCDSLPDDYKKKALALLHKYRPIEDDTQMTVAEKLPYIEEWWAASSNLLNGLSFQYEDIKKSIEKADIKLRDGFDKVFKKLHEQNVPLIILSAGIGDVVELILEHENLVADNVSVVSNFLKLSKDSNGISTTQGFKGEKLIHVFNKNEHAYIDTHENDTLISERHNVILLGDSLGDANMDGGIRYNTVLRIGFFNCSLTENEQAHLDRYKEAFDIVLVQDQTMELLNYLLDEIINISSTTLSSPI